LRQTQFVLVFSLGVTPPALELWDVDGDSVEDVFLGVTAWTNDTHTTQGNKSKFFEKPVKPGLFLCR